MFPPSKRKKKKSWAEYEGVEVVTWMLLMNSMSWSVYSLKSITLWHMMICILIKLRDGNDQCEKFHLKCPLSIVCVVMWSFAFDTRLITMFQRMLALYHSTGDLQKSGGSGLSWSAAAISCLIFNWVSFSTACVRSLKMIQCYQYAIYWKEIMF